MHAEGPDSGVDSSSRFLFQVQTHKQTYTQTQLISVPPAWVIMTNYYDDDAKLMMMSDEMKNARDLQSAADAAVSGCVSLAPDFHRDL